MRRIGTQKRLTEEERGRLIEELRYWQRRSDAFYANRDREDAAFRNVWKGQDASGVRRDTPEEAAWPFEGASDQRVRWGDTAFQDYLALVLVALDASKVEVTCDGSPDGQRRAVAIQKLVSWLRLKLGAKWYRQVMALMRYMLVDTPAVAAMDVGWKVKRTMGVRTLERGRLATQYQAWRVNATNDMAPEEAIREFEIAVGEGVGEGDGGMVVAFLTGTVGCREEDVDDILEALDEEGECEALVTANVWEGPDMEALRYGDDFMLPEATDDFDYADPLIRQQWIGETQLRELAANDDWDMAWVEETLKHKGGNFYDTRNYDDSENMKNLVNICWFYTAETNDEGETTRYVTVMSLADGSAFGKRVLQSRRGKWETVFFQREVLANNCLASRGLAHLCAPDQGLAKSIKDMANNNAIVGSLPPIKAKGSRVRNVIYEPWGVINMGASDDVTFMQPPTYPAAAKERVQELKDDLLAFLGLTNGETDVSTRTKGFSAWMMSQFEELYKRLVEAAQDYASDAALAGVTGIADGETLRHEDLDGDFQLALRFNPANMDHKDLIDRVTALGQVIAPMDAKNEIDRGPVVRSAFAALFPEIAGESFKDAEQMTADDVKDEQENFVKIKAGIMPQMDTQGKWNYQARLDWHMRMQQENPEAIQEMGMRSQEIYQKWIAALEQQARQFGENAQIGRTGVQGVEG